MIKTVGYTFTGKSGMSISTRFAASLTTKNVSFTMDSLGDNYTVFVSKIDEDIADEIYAEGF